MITAGEKHVIRDYLSRHRWHFAISFLAHVGLTCMFWWVDKMAIIAIFGASAVTLSLELNRGRNMTARTLLAQPITAPQLARSWRFVAFTLPAIIFFAALVLGALICAGLGAPRLTGERIAVVAIIQTLLLGTLYFGLIGLPVHPRPNATIGERLTDVLSGLVWGMTFPAIFLMTMGMPSRGADFHPAAYVAGAAMLLATIVGWRNAENLVRKRVARGGGSSKSKTVPTGDRVQNISAWSGTGGLRFFAIKFGSVTAVIFFFILFFGWFFTILIEGGMGQSMGDMKFIQIGMFVPIMAIVTLAQMVTQLRVWRTLPLSRTRLTNWLVFWPLGLATLFGAIAVGFYAVLAGAPYDWTLFATCLTGAAIIQLSVPLVLRYGLTGKGMTPVFLLMISAQMWNVFTNEIPIAPQMHWVYSAALALVAVVVSWIACRRVLASPHPWKPGQFRFPGAQTTA